MTKPQYIYHITDSETWNLAQQQGVYNFCTLKTSGFIHASTQDQYLKVANNNPKFKEKQNLLLLKINTEKVSANIIYENLEGGDDLFPHIYGDFSTEAVEHIFTMKRDLQSNFSAVF